MDTMNQGQGQSQNTNSSMSPNMDMNFDQKDVDDNKLFAALAYLGIISVIMLLVKKDSPFVHAHAKQGVVIFIMSLVTAIPVIGWAVGIFAFVLMLMGIINAAQGKAWKAPLVGDLAASLKF